MVNEEISGHNSAEHGFFNSPNSRLYFRADHSVGWLDTSGLRAGRMDLGVFACCDCGLDGRSRNNGYLLYGRRHMPASHSERMVGAWGGLGIVECAQAQTTTKATPTTFYLRYLTHRLLRYNQVK